MHEYKTGRDNENKLCGMELGQRSIRHTTQCNVTYHTYVMQHYIHGYIINMTSYTSNSSAVWVTSGIHATYLCKSYIISMQHHHNQHQLYAEPLPDF